MSEGKVPPLILLAGDPHLVRLRALDVIARWEAELGPCDREVVDCKEKGAGGATLIVGRILDALRTFSLFSRAKIVWVRNVEALFGNDREASGDLMEGDEDESGPQLGEGKRNLKLELLAKEIQGTNWDHPVRIRLLITAETIDRRRSLIKTIERVGQIEELPALSADLPDWESIASEFVRFALRDRGKEIDEEALSELIMRTGPDTAALESEAEKLSLFVGERRQVTVEDVRTICPFRHYSRAFALADAIGERDLARALKYLADELYQVRVMAGKSEVGLLFGLIAKVRLMLLAKGLHERRYIDTSLNYNQFKSRLQRIPKSELPDDERLDLLKIHSYALYRAFLHSRNYTRAELVKALSLLLECNFRLVSTDVDEALLLQHTIVEMILGERGNTVSVNAVSRGRG